VAKYADIWNVHLMLEPADYQRKLDLLDGYCAEAGRDSRDIRRSMIVFTVLGESDREAQARAAQLNAQPGRGLVGTPQQLADHLLSRTKQGISDFLFSTRTPTDWRTLELIATQVAPLVRKEGPSLLSGYFS
jgi:alkanesulfonate monooxygenase SsuD/methylene tetrahydromethanopterin reductase-like flavin-dependent oxidoreductase (luciferase family)